MDRAEGEGQGEESVRFQNEFLFLVTAASPPLPLLPFFPLNELEEESRSLQRRCQTSQSAAAAAAAEEGEEEKKRQKEPPPLPPPSAREEARAPPPPPPPSPPSLPRPEASSGLFQPPETAPSPSALCSPRPPPGWEAPCASCAARPTTLAGSSRRRTFAGSSPRASAPPCARRRAPLPALRSRQRSPRMRHLLPGRRLIPPTCNRGCRARRRRRACGRAGGRAGGRRGTWSLASLSLSSSRSALLSLSLVCFLAPFPRRKCATVLEAAAQRRGNDKEPETRENRASML